MRKTYTCPLCGATGLLAWARYPRYVCGECVGRAVCEQGRPLTFFNLGVSGGFGAKYADDGSPRSSGVCFIDGRRCIADEARFGGIVVQLTDPPEERIG
ncbi:MAG: hypothetical protein AAFV53_02835 [Myxococcota bacterium]